VKHKLVIPKENLSAKTHPHLLCAAVIIHSNEGGLKFILRLHSPRCGNASLHKLGLTFEDQLVVSSSRVEKYKKKLCGTNYPVIQRPIP
jgi:hypothetical protein